MTPLQDAARIAAVDCMGMQSGEKVVVVTDAPCRSVGQAIFEVVRDSGNQVLLVEITPRRVPGEEPPGEVSDLMKKADLVFCPTSMSMTHTDAKRSAQASGVRVCTLPGITEEVMVRCMNADYFAIAERTNKLKRLLDRTDVIRVTSPAGTDVTMPVKGRVTIASHGLFREKGMGGNLPTGEACLAPLEDETQGKVVIDGSMAGIGMLSTPLMISVRDGYAELVEGGEEAAKLEQLWSIHGRLARAVAEFGIGTNDKARITGVILEDEKVMGTVHIAFGDNITMGGKVRVQSHLDGLITSPSVWLDSRQIMADGKLLV
jgi:leucyl aminopeptidase (aminopeptidase T)